MLTRNEDGSFEIGGRSYRRSCLSCGVTQICKGFKAIEGLGKISYLLGEDRKESLHLVECAREITVETFGEDAGNKVTDRAYELVDAMYNELEGQEEDVPGLEVFARFMDDLDVEL